MARLSWKMKVALVLIGSSAALSLLHVFLFADLHSLLFYLALNVVFVPIQVLLVTVLIERLLTEREKQILLRKLNMVIGAFFGEMGHTLIRIIGATCTDFSTLEQALAVTLDWKRSHYEAASGFIQSYQWKFDPHNVQLEDLREFLLKKRDFVLGLLQNPNLLEHDRFTDLLLAVCHLTEELEARKSLKDLPRPDLKHLVSDIQRAFSLLVREWLSYMQHLRRHYPYIYSLSVRTNPFNSAASPIIFE
ncbi:MAG TPA: hypothetical protein HPP57_07980 [Deltaproteobacteria bacterium]|nr:hypothetical protein [Deltaproteobacteria bacterium]